MRPSVLGLVALAAAAVAEFGALATDHAKSYAAGFAVSVGISSFVLLLLVAALVKYLRD